MNKKRILLLHTGGTIGSAAQADARVHNAATVTAAKRELVATLERSALADCVSVEDSGFPSEETTLSESMTLSTVSRIVRFLRDILADTAVYDGVVVLHGTDTLAYTAALFSFLFVDCPIPLFLVSGNRPPHDPASNATANFIAAVEQIAGGIAPQVYVTYRNADGVMRLYLASCLLQSANFSEDFLGAFPDRVFALREDTRESVYAACRDLSAARVSAPNRSLNCFERLSEQGLLIRPYTGLDYTVFEPTLQRYGGVVHGTYHSGTVCYPKTEPTVPQSIGYLARCCADNGVPLYIAPSALGSDQYETMNAVDAQTSAVLLNMTTEAAYAKLTVALSYGLSEQQLTAYMKTDITGEQQ